MNRVSATSELAQQKDRNKQDLHLQLFSLFEDRKKHSRLSGGGFLASSLPERVREFWQKQRNPTTKFGAKVTF